jgi:DNA-binding transcriptional regulator GbsR (MarR family)
MARAIIHPGDAALHRNASVRKVPYFLKTLIEKTSPELETFVESLGMLFEQENGMPRMIGRILAWLLVCDPPEQSAAELADALMASKGSISTASRVLLRMGLVERVRFTGERFDRFRARPEAWAEAMRRDDQIRMFRAVLRQGLDALADAPPERRARLEETDAIYAWWGERMPALWDEYLEYRRKRTEGKR